MIDVQKNKCGLKWLIFDNGKSISVILFKTYFLRPLDYLVFLSIIQPSLNYYTVITKIDK